MYKPYKTPIISALPDVNVPEPRISKFAILIVRLLVRFYLFFFIGFARTVVQGDALFNAFKRALAGESRCIIAFRHPNGAEPQVLSWFFLFKLRALAAKKGIRFSRMSHAVFVYGYEVARWGGWSARLTLPKMGAMPIHHSKLDSEGMARIYRAITEGPYPVALAPEGQVSYTTDSIPRLESGVIRIGFNAVQQLEQQREQKLEPSALQTTAGKNITCPVEILPVSLHFRYGPVGEASMERLLRKVEKHCGFSRSEAKNLSFGERLRQCRNYILEINEGRYNIKSDTSVSFEERLEQVVNTALETAERLLGVKTEGEFFSRLYKVRQICWDRIYLPGVDRIDRMTRIERGTKDLSAGEAWYISRHQELADFCWYFRRPLPTEETALHNKVEYVQNLYDFANRTMGGAISGRINIFPRKIIIQAAEVINLTKRFPKYKEDKKAAIAAALSELEKAYIDCINEVNSAEL